MTDPTTYRRVVGAASLVAAAALSAGSVLLQPDLSGTPAERLAAIDAAGAAAAVSAALFVVAQLPTLVAVLAVGHLLRDRAPLLSSVAPSVAAAGAFGHAVFGGVMLVTVVMAGDGSRRAAYAELLATLESSPVMGFAALGLLGTVLGVLLLALGVFRARVAPAWVPVGLLLFVVVEFAGQGPLGPWASATSALLLVAAFVRLAGTVLTTGALTSGTTSERMSEGRSDGVTVRGVVHTDS